MASPSKASVAPFPETSVLSPEQIMDAARRREAFLSRLLMAFISSGLIFMLLPGTFLGVWNLLQISGRESVASVTPSWLQAHGHAQVFGWVGSFILGIGLYSIPKLRAASKLSFVAPWACWAMWTIGVTLRWFANVYSWQWRVLLPLSAVLEMAAFLIFARAVSRHRPEPSGNKQSQKLEPWIFVVMVASAGFLLMVVGNLVGCFYVALRGSTPAFDHVLDQRYLALVGWGFLAPFVWGFSAKWMPVFLGLKPVRFPLLFGALALNWAGIVVTFLGWTAPGTVLFIDGAGLAIAALRMFEPAQQAAKTRGVDSSFPLFVRMAYGWLAVSALLSMAAALWDSSGGIWGASRHALTVGFIAVMIFCVGQRILPAFAGMRLLWSTRLMFAALVLLTLGCTLRVTSEILAYQEYAVWAWSVLPASALLELAGVTAFAANIFATFLLEPSHVHKEPVAARIA
jgi:hypothetical protein